jgi:hypothetical protein
VEFFNIKNCKENHAKKKNSFSNEFRRNMEGGIFKSKHRHDKTKPISAGKKYIFFPSIKQVLLKILYTGGLRATTDLLLICFVC